MRMLGLAAPAELWRRLGAQHPFGEDFRGYVDLVPQHYDRPTIEKAIAAVPPELVENGPLLWGTPSQVVGKLRDSATPGCDTWSWPRYPGWPPRRRLCIRSGRCAP